MSIAPETLLRMHPLDALKAQIGEQLKVPMKGTYLRVDRPVSLGGLLTSVNVTLDLTKAPVSLWDKKGTFTFQYERISLPDFLAGLPLRVAAELPSTPQAILGNLFYPFGIPIADTDLVDTTYSALGKASILTSAESWRWVGDVDCTIAMLGLEIAGRVLVKSFTFSHTAAFTSVNVKSQIATHLNLMNASSLADQITSNMFTITAIAENGPQTAGDNTSALLTFNGAPYIGAITVYYGRRSWPLSFRWPVEITGPAYSTTPQLAAILTAQMGCTITVADILAKPVPVMAIGGSQTFPVEFAPTSLAYVGAILVTYTRTT